MDRCQIILQLLLPANEHAPKVVHAGMCALHDPPAIPPQLATILMGRPLMIAAGRDDRFDALPGQACPQGVAIIAPIGDHSLGPFAGSPRFAGATVSRVFAGVSVANKRLELEELHPFPRADSGVKSYSVGKHLGLVRRDRKIIEFISIKSSVAMG
jgi:hypothetical protein